MLRPTWESSGTRHGGSHWRHLKQGLPFVAVFGIEKNLSTGQIVVTTHGRGAFELRKSRFY